MKGFKNNKARFQMSPILHSKQQIIKDPEDLDKIQIIDNESPEQQTPSATTDESYDSQGDKQV